MSKSQTIVRIDSKNKKRARHIDIIQYLKDNYYIETKESVEKILLKLSKREIEEILNTVKPYISTKRYKLIKLFLFKKLEDLKEIYKYRR